MDIVKEVATEQAELLGKKMDEVMKESLDYYLPFEFETIYNLNTTEVTRNKVPGGWLVNLLINSPRGGTELTTTFIADPQHEWEVK